MGARNWGVGTLPAMVSLPAGAIINSPGDILFQRAGAAQLSLVAAGNQSDQALFTAFGKNIVASGGYVDAQTRAVADGTLETIPHAQAIAAAGDTLAAGFSCLELTWGTGANVTLTSVPTLAAGNNGQLVTITNVSTVAGSTITLQDRGTLAGSLLALVAATQVLALRASIKLRYSTARGLWLQDGPLVSPL